MRATVRTTIATWGRGQREKDPRMGGRRTVRSGIWGGGRGRGVVVCFAVDCAFGGGACRKEGRVE